MAKEYEIKYDDGESFTSDTCPRKLDRKHQVSLVYGCKSLTSIIIPEGVTEISASAFSDSELLALITIPNSVTKISESAFAGCISLTTITIPCSITEIDESAFEDCTSLKEIRYGGTKEQWKTVEKGIFWYKNTHVQEVFCSDDTVELPACSIEDGVLMCWYRLVPEVIIPNGVTKISKFAFARCISLTAIIIPCSVIEIDLSAFVNCTSLKEIHYGGTKVQWETVEKGDFWYKNTYVQKVFCSDDIVELPAYSIEDGVLACWYRLVPEAIIPEGVTEISTSAFSLCESLSSVIIPYSVTKIGGNAFRFCTSLKGIHYGGTKEQWEAVEKGDFWYQDTYVHKVFCSDDTVNLPACSIEDNMLKSWCRPVPEVIIPEGVTEINDLAFYDCMSLTSVIIPKSVTKIDFYAFLDCAFLKEIHYDGTKEQWKAVKKDSVWNTGVPAEYVVCTDGTVKL